MLPAAAASTADAPPTAAATTPLPYLYQDVLNIAFNKRWHPLPLRFNAQGLGTCACFATHDFANKLKSALFRPEQLAEIQLSPEIVRFTGPAVVRPSDYLCPWVPYASEPWAYLCSNPFCGEWYR